MRATANPKKTCSKCDKGTGAFSCDGCQQSFCLKHVAEHRQELISQMDNVEQEHDVLHADLVNRTEKQHEHDLFHRIDQWERDAIDQIEQVAKESRLVLKQILNNITDHGQKSLNKIFLKLRRARESDDFFENDLSRWTTQINQLRTEIDCLSNDIQIINNKSNSGIKFIKVVHDQTAESPKTNWTNRFSWLSDVKALFYDPSEKIPSIEVDSTKTYSTQTWTEGSITINKVNQHDRYIDIENDGWTEQDQNMTGWIIQRDIDKKSKYIYQFPDNFILKSRSSVRIACNKPSDIEQQEKEILIDEETTFWTTGSHVVTYLIDGNGKEKASVLQTLV